jgi:predicted ArsR family transcriptional regulator
VKERLPLPSRIYFRFLRDPTPVSSYALAKELHVTQPGADKALKVLQADGAVVKNGVGWKLQPIFYHREATDVAYDMATVFLDRYHGLVDLDQVEGDETVAGMEFLRNFFGHAIAKRTGTLLR